MRGSLNLMSIARQVTYYYTSVDQTRYDTFAGYWGGNSTFIPNVPEHANHIPGGFWHAGPLHWANADYGMDQSVSRHSVWGSNPAPWFIASMDYFYAKNRWSNRI